jgi:hypothetical protein
MCLCISPSLTEVLDYYLRFASLYIHDPVCGCLDPQAFGFVRRSRQEVIIKLEVSRVPSQAVTSQTNMEGYSAGVRL